MKAEFLVLPLAISLGLFMPEVDMQAQFSTVVLDLPIGEGVAAADLNADYYEDIIICGRIKINNVTTSQTRIYLNNRNGTFSLHQTLTGYMYPRISLCDYDNDNDIDFLISGYGEKYGVTTGSILFNNNGSGTFSSDAGNGIFPNLLERVYSWGDYDNDGDQDIFEIGANQNVSDIDEYFGYARILENRNGTFKPVETNIPGLIEGDAKWGDYDNDGDLDVIVSGADSISNRITRIYEFEDGHFLKSYIELYAVEYSRVDWGDYDADGDLDVLVSGSNSCYIYRNDGSRQFTRLSVTGLPDINNGMAKWGDYDLDGDLDILAYWGYNQAVLKNMGDNTFQQITIEAMPYSVHGADWIDYDNDNDLDVLLSETFSTKLIRNTGTIPGNNPPEVPSNLVAEQVGSSVILRWDPSADDRTPDESIQYNVRFGHHADYDLVVSPMGDAFGGLRFVRDHGNSLFAREKMINDLDPGDYYWSVQAKDRSDLTSAFAETEQVYIYPRFSEVFKVESFPETPVCWGDYNNDGYMDAFANGNIYTNQSGSFSLTHTLAKPETIGHAEWVDYDNDGDLDISFAGSLSDGAFYAWADDIYVYTNNNGTFTRNPQLKFQGVFSGNFRWKDFNADGLKDLIMSGYTTSADDFSAGKTQLFLNTKDQGLVEVAFPMPAGEYGYCYVEDLDGDQDYDIIISKFVELCKTFINDGNGGFSERYLGIPSVFRGDYVFADYDNDKDIDLLVAGWDSIINNRTAIYRNEGSYFHNIYADLPRLGSVSLDWLDMDGDYDLDILLTGRDNDYRVYLVENLGNDEFAIESNTDFPLGGTKMELGDYDNDGDSDIMLAGTTTYGNYALRIFRNNYNQKSTPPNPPGNLSSAMDGFDVILSWEEPVDNNEEAWGYSYDIKIGTTPGAVNVIAPESNPHTGHIRTRHRGNACMNNQWRMKDLPLGKYYWSVQAINQSYQTSGWAPMGSFTISRVSPDFHFDTVCLGTPTTFADHSIATDPDEVAGWRWEFGDGGSSTVQNPSYNFVSAGSQQVTLWAFSQSGDSASLTQEVLVLDSPAAGFTAPAVCDREAVIFTNHSYTGGLPGISYLWEFGDGNTAADQSSVQHLYSAPGGYKATLTISADNGCSSVLERVVIVAEYPDANISLAPGYDISFCNGDSTLLAVKENENFVYQWQLNGVDILGATGPGLVVRGPSGHYGVQVENALSDCKASGSQYITLRDAPAAPMIVSENYVEGICPGEDPIILEVETVEGGVDYQWKRNGVPIVGAMGTSYTEFLTEADYVVEASRGGCATSSEVLMINYGEMPPVPEIILRGPVVWYLTCSNDQAIEYRWYRNGERIPGADSYLYVVGSEQGRFEVAISDGSACFARSEPVWIPLGTGVESDIWENLKIYPNPTPGLFTIELDSPVMGELIIDIFRENGQQLINIKFLKETLHFQTEIDLSAQPAGIYLVGLMLEEYHARRSLIVK
jgi:hypothetical protein